MIELVFYDWCIRLIDRIHLIIIRLVRKRFIGQTQLTPPANDGGSHVTD